MASGAILVGLIAGAVVVSWNGSDGSGEDDAAAGAEADADATVDADSGGTSDSSEGDNPPDGVVEITPDLLIRPSLAPIIADEGTVGAFVNARTEYDQYTAFPNPELDAFIDESFPLMLVYTPYFDDKTERFTNEMAYLDLYAIYNNDADPRSRTNPEWILEDEDGEKLFIPFDCKNGTCPQYAADPGDPSFRQHILDEVARIERTGYNRLFLDDVNLARRVSDGTGEEVAPLDPRTGEEMSEEAWATYVVELVELIREEFPNLQIAHNPIWFVDSPGFTSELQWRQIGAADYIMIERSFTDPGLVEGTGQFGFTSFLTWLELLHREGRGLIYLDQHAETASEHEFNIAGYLLVNEGKDVVGTEALNRVSPPELWDGYRVDLGAAQGPYYLWRSLLRRDFDGGTVLLNPPDAQRVTVDLEQTYLTLQNDSVTSVTLDETEAVILRVDDASAEE